MSKTLQSLKTSINRARNSCYYGKYIESVTEFEKVQSKVEAQIFHITDKDLLTEWNKLLEEIKYEKLLVEATIDIMSGSTQSSLPTRVNADNEQFNPANVNLKRNMSKQEPVERKAKMPFGKQPFRKRNHEDDEVYNRKEKQRRLEQQQEQQYQRRQPRNQSRDRDDPRQPPQEDQGVWDQIFPKQKPTVQKPVAKKPSQQQHPIYNANKLKNNQSSLENNNSKNREYQKPWKANAKKNEKKDGSKQEEKKTFLKTCYPDGQGPDSNLIESMEREIVQTSPNITFDDIAELTKAKEILEEAVLLPLAMPDVFTGNRRAWKGVLLFGPPGTGKTLLAKAVASTGATTFFNVTASSLASKWRGQSQKMVRILFEMAKFYAPSTIFIDQIDSLASARGQKEDESSRRVKTQFMARIDGCTTGSSDQNPHLITVIGATNRPWDLDEAIRRRLQKRIYIPLPTQIGRSELLKINLRNEQTDESLDFDQIIKKTEGYSGADIASLCRQAAYMPMRRKLKSEGGLGKKLKDLDWKEQFKKDVNIPLTMDDFKEALKNVKPSVGQSDLKNYMDWMEEFGEQGTK